MIYSDLNQYTPTQKPFVEDVEAVCQSIHNILNTRTTERIFNPEFGSELEDLLFEPMDDITTFRIYRFVVSAIERWDPRVTLNHAQSKVTPFPDDHRYDVFLAFEIEGFGEENFELVGELRK